MTKTDLTTMSDADLIAHRDAVYAEIGRRGDERRESLRLLSGKASPKPRKPRADKGRRRKTDSDDDKWDPDRNIAIGTEGGDTI